MSVSTEASGADLLKPALDAPIPEGCDVILLSPLDIHFSQTRIRAEFQDSHTLVESLADIQTVPLSQSSTEAKEECSDFGNTPSASSRAYAAARATCAEAAVDGEEEPLLLCTPFPRVEVTKWRCKLREADGQPRLDPDSGLELYSEEERWFTFDNRRLCCLQKAALDSWPRKVLCEVIEVPGSLAKQRELRKFDTKTFGCVVTIGRRDDPNPETWSWRTAAGLPPEEQPENGVARPKSNRWRRAPGAGGRGGGRRYANASDEEEDENGRSDIIRSILVFFLIYMALRIVMVALKQRDSGKGTIAEVIAALVRSFRGGGGSPAVSDSVGGVAGVAERPAEL